MYMKYFNGFMCSCKHILGECTRRANTFSTVPLYCLVFIFITMCILFCSPKHTSLLKGTLPSFFLTVTSFPITELSVRWIYLNKRQLKLHLRVSALQTEFTVQKFCVFSLPF